MEKLEMIELANTATFAQDQEVANAAMEKLRAENPTWHWCLEYDGLAICDEDDEWQHCYCFKEFNEDSSVKEDFAKDPEIKEWVEHEREERERFIRNILKKHMKWYHKPWFWIYEKMADFFAPRVYIIMPKDYQEGQFGVKLYGVEYLSDMKPTQTHE